MSERQLQFRVGLFVLASLVVATALVIEFGDVRRFWEESYQIAIHFAEAPGVQEGTPVRQNGITIGSVSDILLDEEVGGVLVVVDVQADRALRRDSHPALVRTLLGDATIDFSPGASSETLPPNSRIEGAAPSDPMEIVRHMEGRVNETLTAFTETSREWQRLGRNVNSLIETRQGNLDEVIERAAVALDQFTRTMSTAGTTLEQANSLLADPQVQADLKATIASLPRLVEETRQTIALARTSVQNVSDSLNHLSRATEPLADHSRSLVTRLDGSLEQLELLLTELSTFARLVNSGDGTLRRFAADPALYENLNDSAAAMAALVEHLQPIMADLRIFSDRVARHPEILGVSGALRGSSGLKDPLEESPAQPGVIQQTGGTRRPPTGP